MAEQGDIVLIPVPFTDLSSQKRCPVIVIPSDAYNRRSAEAVVVAMTSNPAQAPYGFQITSADLADGTLNHPGTVRVDKIYTLAQSLAVRRFARVSSPIIARIRHLLADLTDPTQPLL